MGASDDDELKTHMLLYRFKDYSDGGEVFKQFFVLYACSTILALLSEHKIRYNLLPVVKDVNSIPTFIGVITPYQFLLLRLHTF